MTLYRPRVELDQRLTLMPDTIQNLHVPNSARESISSLAWRFQESSVEIIMTKKLYGLCGALALMGACYAGWAFAGPRDAEEVTVRPPYTIRMQPLVYDKSGMVQEARTTVEASVSYADLDFSKQADVDTMRDRLRTAARDNCRTLHRNPHILGYIPTDEAACVRSLTLQSFAQLDEIRASAARYASRQSARN